MKTCTHCGEQFQPSRSDRIYCSSLCSSRAFNERRTADGRLAQQRADRAERIAAYNRANRKRWYVERTCTACGETWETSRKDARYCSPRCRASVRAKPVQLTISLPQPIGLKQLFDGGRFDDAMASILARTVVRADGCRVIKGQEDVDYPQVRWGKGKRRTVHRLVLWAKIRGPIDSWQAHHACANAWCVEPAHIVPATAAENIAEMKARKTYEAEIAALREALTEHAPGHPLLSRSLV